MSVTIHVPTPDTPAKMRRAVEAPPRPAGRPAGGWIDDHVALGKMITLCPLHLNKFNPRHHRYEVWRQLYVKSRCDDCGHFDPHCRAFIPQALHDAVGQWTRPRRGRWAS